MSTNLEQQIGSIAFAFLEEVWQVQPCGWRENKLK
jgi:hypothetical protein